MTDIVMPKYDRHWLVYHRSIETTVRRGAASKYITEYLDAIGYEQTQISPTMQFQRGWSLASLFNPNPKKQKTEIAVDFASAGQQTVIEVTMRINCFGNRPLSKDYEFWQAELEGFADVLEHGYINPMISDYAAERALWYNVTITIIVLFVVLLLTVASFIGLLLLAFI